MNQIPYSMISSTYAIHVINQYLKAISKSLKYEGEENNKHYAYYLWKESESLPATREVRSCGLRFYSEAFRFIFHWPKTPYHD